MGRKHIAMLGGLIFIIIIILGGIILLVKPDLTIQSNILAFLPDKKDKEEISLVAVGDVMLDRHVRTLMNRQGLDYPFQKIDKSIFQEADILLGNLEGPVVSKKTKFGHLTFGMLHDILPVLRSFGFDVFSLSNNHALDQGWTGHDETKKFLSEAGLSYFGHPTGELHEENVHFTEVKGKTFAFVGLEDVFKEAGPEKQAIENIHRVLAEVKKKTDYIIIFPHWGTEYTKTPTPRQRNFAHAFIDAGADIVIGHHPHVVQDHESYRGKLIYYSLGNFIFDQYWSKETQKGLVLKIGFHKKGIYVRELPIVSEWSQPSFVEMIQ